MKITVNEELLNKIEKIKGLLAHKNANLSTAELLNILCDLGIEKWDKATFAAPRKLTTIASNENGTVFRGLARLRC